MFRKLNQLVISQIRFLNLQEYQSKSLMEKFGINVQKFKMASSKKDALEISKSFKAPEFVIKAQILAGGRGKGVFSNGYKSGVHLTKNPEDIPDIVGSMIGQNLITKQTSKDGVKVNKVMVAHALDIAREMYLAFVLDRAGQTLVLMSSPRGGVDIEEVAKQDPDAILKTPLDMDGIITEEQGRQVAHHLGFTKPRQMESLLQQLRGLQALFIKHDCTQIEINPLGETPDGEVVCFDAKLNFDDNASFRQREIFDLFDPVSEEQDPRETAANQVGLNYIGLQGDIGCVVNGAGLAMATMDMVQLHGGKPANFLDLGGGVTVSQVEQAFQILQSDKQVRAVLVNIFGGIVNCATVANGLVEACTKVGVKVPLVVRLEGTNSDEARRILANSGLVMQTSSDLDEAARLAVASLA